MGRSACRFIGADPDLACSLSEDESHHGISRTHRLTVTAELLRRHLKKVNRHLPGCLVVDLFEERFHIHRNYCCSESSGSCQ